MNSLCESTVGAAALGWLENLGWRIAHGPDLSACDAQAGIAPITLGAELVDYGEIVMCGACATPCFPSRCPSSFGYKMPRN